MTEERQAKMEQERLKREEEKRTIAEQNQRFAEIRRQKRSETEGTVIAGPQKRVICAPLTTRLAVILWQRRGSRSSPR